MKKRNYLYWVVYFFIIFFIVACFIVYIWVYSLPIPSSPERKYIQAELNQGNINGTTKSNWNDSDLYNKCLVKITAGARLKVDPTYYVFNISTTNGNFHIFRWNDRNTTFTIDSGKGGTDAKCWDPGETIAFDCPPELYGMNDGTKIGVEMLNKETGDKIISEYFTFHTKP
jgi:hypothetical protein